MLLQDGGRGQVHCGQRQGEGWGVFYLNANSKLRVTGDTEIPELPTKRLVGEGGKNNGFFFSLIRQHIW